MKNGSNNSPKSGVGTSMNGTGRARRFLNHFLDALRGPDFYFGTVQAEAERLQRGTATVPCETEPPTKPGGDAA